MEPGSLYAGYPRNRNMTARVRAFVDWVTDLFATHEATRLRRPGEAPACPVDYPRRETEKSR